MRYFSIMIIMLLSVNLFAQSTSWNEYKLKKHWKTNGVDEIEGIYENVAAENENTPKYKLALVKTSNGYNLIYLSGASAFVSADRNEARNPQRFIHANR